MAKRIDLHEYAPLALDTAALDLLDALARAADPTPWRVGYAPTTKVWARDPDALGGPVLGERCVLNLNEHTAARSAANGAFLVAAVNLAPGLLARVRELEALLTRAQPELDGASRLLHATFGPNAPAGLDRLDALRAEIRRALGKDGARG